MRNRTSAAPAYKGRLAKTNSLRFWSATVLTALLGVASIIAVGLPLIRNYSQRLWLQKQIAGTQSDITRYEQQNKDLKEMIDYLASDQAVEEKARLSLGLKKAGESVVVIQEPGSLNKPDIMGKPLAAAEATIPQKWFHYFFD
jgi:cell division protein FtsB